MLVFLKCTCNIFRNGYFNILFIVMPVKVDTAVECAILIKGDVKVVFEKII